MGHFNRGWFSQQVSFMRRMFGQADGLPFSQVLSSELVADALRRHGLGLTEPVYNALVTTWVFLSQVMSADSCCRAAVARLIAHRCRQGQSPCSSQTGGYCQARQRLPEGFAADLVRHTGSSLEKEALPSWRWKDRSVMIFDGSTVSMPDTPENQKAYPQHATQQAGVGFPLARIGVLFSLAAATVLDLAICPFRGKGNSELGLLRQVWHHLVAGSVLLADRYICCWFEIALLDGRNVKVVCRLHSQRRPNWRKGNDQRVTWPKPERPFWMDQATYDALPDELTIRLLRLKVARRGFRTREIRVATTLLDRRAFTPGELADLYRARWHAELDLRSLKSVMQMDILRGKTPDIVRKEIWMHLLAYNLIRTVMAQAAMAHDVNPRAISFKAALQTLEAFRPQLLEASRDALPSLIEQIIQAIITHQVGQRPNRCEPRARKRRPKPYPLLQHRRTIARKLVRYKS
jgi:Transposase DDE domain